MEARRWKNDTKVLKLSVLLFLFASFGIKTVQSNKTAWTAVKSVKIIEQQLFRNSAVDVVKRVIPTNVSQNSDIYRRILI